MNRSVPPETKWNGILGLTLSLVLVAVSNPGFDLLLFAIGFIGTLVLGLYWYVRVAAWTGEPDRSNARRWWWGPVMVVVAVGLVWFDVPLHLRFVASRPAFDAVVRDLEPKGDVDHWSDLGVPDRIGTYKIHRAYQAGENVIIFDRVGAFVDEAGFAYLPNGPDDDLEHGLFEAPQFRSLGGDWYAWTASW